MAALTNVGAIKQYFEAEPNGRKVTLTELKALSRDDRAELGKLAAVELGCEIRQAV